MVEHLIAILVVFYFLPGLLYWQIDIVENNDLPRAVGVAIFWPIFFIRSVCKGLKEAWNE